MQPKCKIRKLDKVGYCRDIDVLWSPCIMKQVHVDWWGHILESNLAYLAKMLCPPTTQLFDSFDKYPGEILRQAC